MIITAIEPRRKSLSAIYIDGEFALKLDTETVLSERLRVGTELDDDRLYEIIKKANSRRAKEKALWLISYRDHSEGELRKKLNKDYDDEAVDSAIDRLAQLGLINDENFATKYAESLKQKHLSARQIQQKLREKGLDRELTEATVDELELDEKEELRALINKKYLNKLKDDADKRRTISALQRRGFSFSDIRAVIEEFTDIEDY